MKRVSKAVYDSFYEKNLETLNRTPLWDGDECSVTYYFVDSEEIACKWVEKKYNKVVYYIA